MTEDAKVPVYIPDENHIIVEISDSLIWSLLEYALPDWLVKNVTTGAMIALNENRYLICGKDAAAIAKHKNLTNADFFQICYLWEKVREHPNNPFYQIRGICWEDCLYLELAPEWEGIIQD